MKTTTNRFGKTSLSTNFGNIKEFLTRQNRLSDFDMNAIRAYNAQIDACVTSQTAFNRTMLNASKTAQDMVANANGNTVALNNMTRASKASELALKGLAIAGNMIAFMAASAAINAVVTKINSYTNAASEAKQSSETLVQKMKDFDSSASSNARTLDGLNNKYKELSKGVNKLGGNVSLSTSEYEEYKDIIQQVHEIMPGVAVNFNSQGEAIAFTTEKITDLTKAYEEYRKKANSDFLSNGDGEGNTVQDIIDTYNNQTKKPWYDNLWKRITTNGGWLNYLSGSDNPAGKILEMAGGANNICTNLIKILAFVANVI